MSMIMTIMIFDLLGHFLALRLGGRHQLKH